MSCDELRQVYHPVAFIENRPAMSNRNLSVLAFVILLAAGVASLYRVYDFGQNRFFTIDEYQFGHATWLVS